MPGIERSLVQDDGAPAREAKEQHNADKVARRKTSQWLATGVELSDKERAARPESGAVQVGQPAIT